MPGIGSYIYGSYPVYGGAKLSHRSVLLCFLFQLEEALVQLSQPVNCRMLFFNSNEFSALGMLRA